ncbi:FAD-dependent oxidoreductase [Patescibacteria group bacterium]|nr:FAD-dependent oxidoreductase [Patescibacteria group bacterium]
MKKIIIAGAGFGGLKTALLLHAELLRLGLLEKYEIVLIDRNPYHTYTPLLYEAATTSKEFVDLAGLESVVTFPISMILKGKKITFLERSMSRIDLEKGVISFVNHGDLLFDYAVLALGSETNYFNIPGMAEHALTLKSFRDAVEIRDALWNKMEQHVRGLRVVIGGGGSTGVELAGEVRLWLEELEQEFKTNGSSVTIIEGMPTVLGGFAPKIVAKVMSRLQKIGVTLMTQEFIQTVSATAASLKSGKTVPFDVLIWTGGVKPSSLTDQLPLRRDKRGHIDPSDSMDCPAISDGISLHGRIYALGDATSFYPSGAERPIPMTAQTAIGQAKVVAHNLIEDIEAAEGRRAKGSYVSYTPKEYPYVIPVGGKYAVAKIGPLVLSGIAGWIVKCFVELYYLLGDVLPNGHAMRIWLKGLGIFLRNDRLG